MKKLAIVGSGLLTRELAPFGDNQFDIWVFNEAPMSPWCKRWTASFQLHNSDIYAGPNLKQAEYWKWLQAKHGKPVYMQEYDERVPDCVVYPVEAILQLTGKRYLGMSPCFAVALALLQGYEHIEIYGIELSSTEYQFGADSWRFWIGYAIGRLGADHVIIKSGQHLFETALYGYDGAAQLDHKYFEDRARYLDNSWLAKDKVCRNLFKNIERLIEKYEAEKLPEQIQIYQDAVFELGQLAGALGEAEKYCDTNGSNADRNEYEQSAAKIRTEGQAKQVEMERYAGKCEYVWNAWRQSKSNPAFRQQAQSQLLNMIVSMAKSAQEAGICHGVYTENVGYMQKHDEMVQANGGYMAQHPIPYPEMVK